MQRSTQPPQGHKRLNINIDSQLLNRFKAAAALKGENMTDILIEFIRHYVGQRGKKKTRR
jgi:hypothetical protein